MINNKEAFSSFSVSDLDEAKEFYGETLGLNVKDTPEGLQLSIGALSVFLYPKDDHEPATFTVLNFPVDDVEKTVDELTEKGVEFEQYTGDIETDEKGIFHGGEGKGGGPEAIAWFADPAGNILSVMAASYQAEDNKKSASAKAK
jgi:catechol 2,3-dioxygenase-like lactoylglutathione lyase family enzyme